MYFIQTSRQNPALDPFAYKHSVTTHFWSHMLYVKEHIYSFRQALKDTAETFHKVLYPFFVLF